MSGLLRLVAALCALVMFGAPAAFARPDLFQISGVRVDATGANASEARTAGFNAGKRLAFDRLVRRVAAPAEVERLGVPTLEGIALDRIVTGVDVEDERRAGARYVGRLTIGFDPAQVRTLLRAAGFSVLETRAPTTLIVAQFAGGAPQAQDQFRQAWEQGGFAQELAPLAIAPATVIGAPDWTIAQPAASAVGAAGAVFVTARLAGSSLVADLVEVGPNGVKKPRGTVSAPATIGEAGLASAMVRLAEAANARLQADWKGSLNLGAATKQKLNVAAEYATQREWIQIKRALNAATATILSDVQIQGVAKRGALVSFSYVGTPEQLAAEFGRTGVALDGSQPGLPVLRAGGG
jgi:hypothetical protein